MPSITIEWLKKNIKNCDISKEYPVFIETGTYKGDTIIPIEPYFKELHTIEIKKDYLNKVKRKYRGKKIQFHLGVI